MEKFVIGRHAYSRARSGPKVYSGDRGRYHNWVEVRESGSTRTRPLDLRLDLFFHRPTEFEWGYGGSGPTQLAMAILAEYLGDDPMAVRLHQAFKWSVIAKFKRAGWRCRRAISTGGSRSVGNETRCAAGNCSLPAKTRPWPRRARTVRRKRLVQVVQRLRSRRRSAMRRTN